MKRLFVILFAAASAYGSEVTPESFSPGRISDEDRAWWAFQPVNDPALPEPSAEDRTWGRNGIDSFVLRKLRENGLAPAIEAGRRELVRRVYFDLTGLPPTPEEVRAFLEDKEPNAWERLIDRLLASPRYGERWGQHWLDIVRYAESDGYRQDAFRPEVWRYRDYVIRSFNEDKPYDRFVKEQLAGDEFDPGNKEALHATMYLRHWIYEHNQRDVENQWRIILNDITATTSDVFLGMGLACAQCHHHKFDPLLQDDYYRMQAFFAAIMPRKQQPLADMETRRAYFKKHQAWQEKSDPIRKRLHEIEWLVLLKNSKGEGYPKFVDELKAMIHKRKADRTPYEQQIADMSMNQIQLQRDKLPEHLPEEVKAEWEQLRKELAALDELKPKPLPGVPFAVSDVGPTAPPTFIPDARDRKLFPPGFLTILDPKPAAIPPVDPALQSTGRRLALADWIASKKNPLSGRVIVNRIWQYHFGRGLVATPNDFGRLGEKPSHPELLDWLVKRFEENGRRMKPMHRLILTSAAWRQTSRNAPSEIAVTADPENRLLWRFPPRRLDAEEIRDAILQVTGELDLQKTSGASSDGKTPRRSIFIKRMRNTPNETLSRFNLSDAFDSTPVRSRTTTPLQALLLFNSDWAQQRSTAFARRIIQSSPSTPERIDRAFQLAFGRPPNEDEQRRTRAFINNQKKNVVHKPEPKIPDGLAATENLFPSRPFIGSKTLDLTPLSPRQHLKIDVLPESEGDRFTVEAVIRLRSLYPDGRVRTIASRWNGNTRRHGWNFGVTSKGSRYTPRNLIVQLVGRNAEGKTEYKVVPSGLLIPVDTPYY
ncbi:MAG: DUF1549 and DUF1553 domain-containing protein, partial [Verrucomicrobiota bacterium]